MKEEIRILALDVGEKRIGVAISDPLGITAQGLPTIERKNKKNDVAKIKEIVAGYSLSKIVVGMPKNLDGSLGKQAALVTDFIESIEKEITDINIIAWDERFSTQGAERILIESGLKRLKRKKHIDKLAAQWILQGYLESVRYENE